jgi:hypothetical protein
VVGLRILVSKDLEFEWALQKGLIESSIAEPLRP